MSKSDVKAAQERAAAQVANTSAGGHLGGTYYGQQPDGKTATMKEQSGGKARPNDGSN